MPFLLQLPFITFTKSADVLFFTSDKTIINSFVCWFCNQLTGCLPKGFSLSVLSMYFVYRCLRVVSLPIPLG